MKWTDSGLLFALMVGTVIGCVQRGVGRSRGKTERTTPILFLQHVPNVGEMTLTASGLPEGAIARDDGRFKDLVPNYNKDVVFVDREGSGADRMMTEVNEHVCRIEFLVFQIRFV